jgi:hypothetical protein
MLYIKKKPNEYQYEKPPANNGITAIHEPPPEIYNSHMKMSPLHPTLLRASHRHTSITIHGHLGEQIQLYNI